MKRAFDAPFFIAFAWLIAALPVAAASPGKQELRQLSPPATSRAARPGARDGEAKARLIEVYRLLGQARGREALAKAESLVRDHPNFQPAQLVYGDLLAARARPLRTLGDVPDTPARAAAPLLAELREESQLRLKALRERPPAGAIPSQFLALSPRNKHAVDASRSRLYLFENSPEFKIHTKTLAEWMPALRSEIDKVRGRGLQLKDISFLRWTDKADTMVVTFGEVAEGTRSGPTKRQYWMRQGHQWKTFFEGVIG